MAILKQDVAYGKEQIRDLEQKCNNQEAQLKSQHELIARLQNKAMYYKEVSQGTKTEFNTTKVQFPIFLLSYLIPTNIGPFSK